jgi:hypothetical protein
LAHSPSEQVGDRGNAGDLGEPVGKAAPRHCARRGEF